MPYTSRQRLVNPRLGSFFGIFASAFAALVIMGMIVEQLGVSETSLRWLLLLGPIALYSAYGLAAPTSHALDYFAAGRRVPAVYTGLMLSIFAFGATGIVAVTGLLFFIGFDAFPFLIGTLAGFVVMAVLLAPFIRKFGAYTVPTYLGRRFESRTLRLASAGLLAIPLLLVLAAELSVGTHIAAWLVDASPGALLAMLVLCVLLVALPGGLRSLSWSSTAQAIAVLLAILVPASIVAVILTKIPVPQLSFGPIVRSLVREEAQLAIPELLTHPLALDLPGEGFSVITKRFVTPFGAVGGLSFLFLTLTMMAGVAASPSLLTRVASTPGVYEARKSLGWATLFLGVLFLTMTAVAAFLREPLISLVAGGSAGAQVPDWLTRLQAAGVAQLQPSQEAARLTVGSVAFTRCPDIRRRRSRDCGLARGSGQLGICSRKSTVRGCRRRPCLGASFRWSATAACPHHAPGGPGWRSGHSDTGADRPADAPALGHDHHGCHRIPGSGAVDLVEATECLRCARRNGDGIQCRHHRHHGGRARHAPARRTGCSSTGAATRDNRCNVGRRGNTAAKPARAGAGPRHPRPWRGDPL